MESGIYVWKLDGVPKYIGQSSDIDDRMFRNHIECNVLYKAVKKYGYDAFEKEVVCYCDEEELSDLEIYYIKEFHTHVSEGGYNVSLGGEAFFRGGHHSEKTKNKISDAMKGESHPFFGKHHSEESKNKISESNKGRQSWLGKHHSDETKNKMSENHANVSGENNPRFGKKLNNSSSKYYGVSLHKHGKYSYWETKVYIDKKDLYIAQYKNEIDAAKAYDQYVVEHNIDRPLNFPEDYL